MTEYLASDLPNRLTSAEIWARGRSGSLQQFDLFRTTMNEYTLHFQGPFSYLNKESSLFHSENGQDEGIYLWVIKDISNNVNYIHYVGETTNFSKRHREHLTHILGLNYQVIDADSAKQGICRILWNGMWRDKRTDAAKHTLDNYASISRYVVNYVKCCDIYLAPTKFSREIRRHIEGCIGWNLKNKHPELTRFYPADMHTGMMKEPLNKTLTISSDQPIAGLDDEIRI